MTHRFDSRLAGCAYLSYVVFTMASSILYGRATAGESDSQALANLSRTISQARVTVLLDLLQIVCAVVLAVTLYRLVSSVNPTIALLAMFFRLGEGLLGFLPLLSKLELMRLATDPSVAFANASSVLLLANENLHRPDDGFSQFCFVVGGFMFAYLFLRGRLIPRWLGWIGVVTIGAQLICVPLHIAMIIPGSVVDMLWMPILLYEIPLGIWLIMRGTPCVCAPVASGKSDI
ncbi:DUF4386 domain-containing protein [Granulicella arctica]|uniref:DUF4386 domain-containing protein n=1 Tax=Granulicella arctica TaxID=940613 RepID=UPI0021DF5302|nr:DUF4386 domain-containing protein [Granulicella arctica]